MMVVGKPDSELVLLQQPIQYEHNIILSKVCDDIGLDKSLLYVTNLIKCSTTKIKKDEVFQCSQNLKAEIEYLKPVSVIVCGKDIAKYYKRFINDKYIEIPSLFALLNGKRGISRMKETLKIIKDTYFG